MKIISNLSQIMPAEPWPSPSPCMLLFTQSTSLHSLSSIASLSYSPAHDGIWPPSQSPTAQPGSPCPKGHSTPPRRCQWPAGAQSGPQYPPCGSPKPRSVLERRAGRQVLSGLTDLCFGVGSWWGQGLEGREKRVG